MPFIRIIKMMQFQLKLIIILLSICKLITIVHAKAPGHLQPVLGWNTWCTQNQCGNDWCTEKEIISVGKSMKENGLLDAGYEYLNLDDCWGVRNNETNHIEADAKRFPSGMKSLVSKIHKLGFKLGIYTDMGSNGCHHPFTGSWPFYYQDAIDFSHWGIDYVKFDYCDPPKGYLPEQLTANFSNALKNTNIWLNFHCNWLTFENSNCGIFGNSFRIAPDHVDAWYSTVKTSHALMNRKPWWGDNNNNNNNNNGDNDKGFPDPDFVFTGGQGCGEHGTINPPGIRCPGQSDEEYRTEFGINVIASGQILFASDPRNMSEIQKEILLNGEVLSVFKDTSGLTNVLQIHKQNSIIPTNPNDCNVQLTKQLSHGSGCVKGVDYGCINNNNNNNTYEIWVANGCRAMFSCYGTKNVNCESGGNSFPNHNNITCNCNPPSPQIWIRRLKNVSQIAVLLVNIADESNDITIQFKDILSQYYYYPKMKNKQLLSSPSLITANVRDLFKKKDLGKYHSNYTAIQVAPHASIFLRLGII